MDCDRYPRKAEGIKFHTSQPPKYGEVTTLFTPTRYQCAYPEAQEYTKVNLRSISTVSDCHYHSRRYKADFENGDSWTPGKDSLLTG